VVGREVYTYWSKVLRGANADQPEFMFGVDGDKKIGATVTSWCMMKLPGRILCRCFARVVLPEHVAPLRRKIVIIRYNIPQKRMLCAHICACVGHKHTYPIPTRITRAWDPGCACSAFVAD